MRKIKRSWWVTMAIASACGEPAAVHDSFGRDMSAHEESMARGPITLDPVWHADGASGVVLRNAAGNAVYELAFDTPADGKVVYAMIYHGAADGNASTGKLGQTFAMDWSADAPISDSGLRALAKANYAEVSGVARGNYAAPADRNTFGCDTDTMVYDNEPVFSETQSCTAVGSCCDQHDHCFDMNGCKGESLISKLAKMEDSDQDKLASKYKIRPGLVQTLRDAKPLLAFVDSCDQCNDPVIKCYLADGNPSSANGGKSMCCASGDFASTCGDPRPEVLPEKDENGHPVYKTDDGLTRSTAYPEERLKGILGTSADESSIWKADGDIADSRAATPGKVNRTTATDEEGDGTVEQDALDTGEGAETELEQPSDDADPPQDDSVGTLEDDFDSEPSDEGAPSADDY